MNVAKAGFYLILDTYTNPTNEKGFIQLYVKNSATEADCLNKNKECIQM